MGDPGQSSAGRLEPARRTWWLSFALLATLGAGWTLATPIFAAPDEPSQLIRAWSVAHGELFGSEFGPHHHEANPFGTSNVSDYGLLVRAPATYQNFGNAGCVAHHPERTANCVSLGHSTRVVEVLTYTGRYFPAYYFLVGLPSLVSSPGSLQLYLMRLVSVLLCAALLASAIVTTRRAEARSLAATGVVLAITPMALFLAGTVNPSGVEIAAAIAVWTSGALLARTAAEGVDARLVGRLGIAAVALCVARPLGPLWLVIAGAVLAFVAGANGLRALWRSGRARVWAGVVLGATVLHLSWNLWAAAYDLRHYEGLPTTLNYVSTVRHSASQIFVLQREMVGSFGWLDTSTPRLTFVVWLLALLVLVGLAVAFGPRRWSLALGAVAGLTLVLPIAFEAIEASRIGFQWQGRYTLPIAVGVPVLAGFSAWGTSSPRWARRRLGGLLIGAVTLAQVAAFGQALRRYSVGANGTIWFFTRAAWEPPIPGLVLLIVFAVTMGLFLWFVLLPRPAEDAQAAVLAPT